MFITLDELKQVLNENCIIILYDYNQNILGVYDGHDSIDDFYDDCGVNDIFTDAWGKKPAIGIELDYLPFL